MTERSCPPFVGKVRHKDGTVSVVSARVRRPSPSRSLWSVSLWSVSVFHLCHRLGDRSQAVSVAVAIQSPCLSLLSLQSPYQKKTDETDETD